MLSRLSNWVLRPLCWILGAHIHCESTREGPYRERHPQYVSELQIITNTGESDLELFDVSYNTCQDCGSRTWTERVWPAGQTPKRFVAYRGERIR